MLGQVRLLLILYCAVPGLQETLRFKQNRVTVTLKTVITEGGETCHLNHENK